MIISPINVEIPISQSQPNPLVTPQHETISTSEEMAYICEDVVVSLGKYFWSRKDKEVIKNGTKRTKEGIVKHVLTLNQVISKLDSPDIKERTLDTTVSMGDLVGAKFYSISQLNKDFFG